MTEGEIAVVLIDAVPTGREDDPRTTAEAAEDRLHGILEGGLLVAVGLSALAVDAIVSAILRPGILTPVDGGTDDREPLHSDELETPPTDTAAVFVGAALDLAFEASRGLMRMFAGLERAIRPLTLVAMVPPVDRAARRLEEIAIRRNESWQEARLESARAAELFADAVVPQLVDVVVERLDLTDLILENVDLDRVISDVDIDRIVERVDLHAVISRVDIDEIVRGVDVTAVIDGVDIDGVAARVDVQRIVDRLDLVAIAQGVIDELDLPAIIRGSTETMATETVDGIRVQGMHADRFVARVVDRTLHRRNGGASGSSDQSDPSEEGS